MNNSLNYYTLRETLGKYIDFDFADELSPPKRKRNGKYYSTYTAELQPQYATLAKGRRSVVIKEMSMEQAKIYQKLSSIWHPNLETIYGVLPVGDFFVSLNEFIAKPAYLYYPSDELKCQRTLSLEEYIQNFGCFSEKEALIFALQLCEGLEALNKQSLVHGDISPQNILLTDRLSFYPAPYFRFPGLHRTVTLKIIDFDITKTRKEEEHLVTSVEGTNPYAAPEILDYKTPNDRVDIYSLGCVLTYMLTGKSPKQDSKKKLDKLYGRPIKRIIDKCTSNYSLRYKNMTQLKRILAQQLSPIGLLCRIPGFRFGYFTHMCAATFVYCYLLFHFLSWLLPDSRYRPWAPVIILSVVMLFDMLQLGDRSPHYVRFREKHFWIRYVARFILGIIVPYILLPYVFFLILALL